MICFSVHVFSLLLIHIMKLVLHTYFIEEAHFCVVEGANRIAEKLSFVILYLSFEMFEDEFFVFLDSYADFYENYEFQCEKHLF